MRKSFYILILSTAFFSSIKAQVGTQKVVLRNTAISLESASRSNFSEAIIKSKEKGWPIQYKSRNNQSVSLIGVDHFGQPIYLTTFTDPVQAITINTNQLWQGGISGLNLSGASDSITNRIGIWDESSPRLTHQEFAGRITVKDNASKIVDHPTHVAGIIMGKGVNPMAKGMSYGIKGAYAYDWNNDASEMAAAAANGLLISNHSYGTVCGWDYNNDSSRWEFNGRWNEKEDYKFGLYTNSAQTYDSIAYNAPYYLIVKSAGNNRSSAGPAVGQPYWRRDESGKLYNAGNRPDSLSSNNSYETLPTDANAKNILTVGAIGPINSGYLKASDAAMTSFSSWGPTDDGRIKPDIVTDGSSVYSAVSSTDSSYNFLSGTSMAAPGAAGSLLLLQELSQKLSPNKFIKAATVKGLAIHTAGEAGTSPGPDYKFGWGVLNMSEAAAVLNNAYTNNNNSSSPDLVYENILQNGQTANFNVTASGIKPLKATIVWTDVKGTVESTLNDTTHRLVNDLDLVIKKGTNTYYPWTLNRTLPDNAAVRGINSVDNVEKVELDSTLVGNDYTISVNHKGILDRGQQAYSLIISGAGGSAYCASTASSTAGTKMDSVSFNNIQFNNSTTNQYIDNSNLFILGEPGGNIPVFIKLNSVDASNNTRFVKIFIDYNNNGIFDTNETALTSSALTNGNYTTTITLPTTITVGKLMKFRVVVTETNSSANVNACGTYAIGETQDYTLKAVNASNDLQISDIINPTANVCKRNTQYVTVKMANNGSNNQSNIPLSLVVKKGATTILNINETFNGRLNGLETMNYTFQTPIPIEANTNYTIIASANILNDQQPTNNALTANIVSAADIIAPTGNAVSCNGTLKLTVNNAVTGTNYYWYDSSNLYNPIAIGSNTSAVTNSNKFYLTQGYQTTLPPSTNTSLAGSGSYNSFNGNYMKLNATTALTLETTRLYSAYPGKVDFILGTLGTVNTDGSFTYYPIQTASLNIPASSPKPAIGASPFVVGDTGRIYALNLNIPKAGDYIIITKCDSASLFRNNAATDPTYPLGPSRLISFTGNSVAAASGNYQNYFYFFYNTQVSTPDCMSSPSLINLTTNSKPTITQSGDSLICSAGSGYQWYINDSLIVGATKQSYKPTRNALYKVATTTIAGDCQNNSDNILILVTDVAEASAKEINLKITSNDYVEHLIRGNSFYIQFSNIQTQGISLEIINSMGGKVFHKDNLINQRTPQHVTIGSLTTGIYFVKIYANNKVYVQRVFVTNN
jgi:Subtilase family/GEVED domain/Secretion system C-terminal sorting domain